LLVGEPAVAVNVALEAPAGTVAEAGTLTHVLFDKRAITEPFAGAGAEIVTVQMEFAPDAMLAGEHRNADTVMTGGASVSDVDAEVPLEEAVIAAV
jgi:hypothetical protein